MKKFKRNAVILTVLLFVCVAVYLNWSYNKNEAELDAAAAITDTADVSPASAESAGLYYSEGSVQTSQYFAEARLNREEARSSVATALSTVSETEGASQEAIDAALSEISELTELTLKEAELESLIIAKGFDDCVVYISEQGVNVTVPSPTEGLSAAAVARITDVVLTETDYTADMLKVIEIKA